MIITVSLLFKPCAVHFSWSHKPTCSVDDEETSKTNCNNLQNNYQYLKNDAANLVANLIDDHDENYRANMVADNFHDDYKAN